MRVLLINIDSVWKNLALEKIALYHQGLGHEVIRDMPLMANQVDKIYVSCVFEKNKDEAAQYEAYDNAVIGGSGYDIEKNLPCDIESVLPRLNMGYTTRGCMRRCPWCIVPQKEGSEVYVVGSLDDLWDGEAKEITLMDNNILGVLPHFYKVCFEAIEHKLTIDFNQGLDHRLVTHDVASALRATRLKEYRFAYDSPAQRSTVDDCIDVLIDHNIRDTIWYVLTGFNTDIHEDIARLNHLRDRGELAFVQRYTMYDYLNPVARWANQRAQFRKKTFGEFLQMKEKKAYYKKLLSLDLYEELIDRYQ